MEEDRLQREGFIAALEWVLNSKPTKSEIREKIKFNRALLGN